MAFGKVLLGLLTIACSLNSVCAKQPSQFLVMNWSPDLAQRYGFAPWTSRLKAIKAGFDYEGCDEELTIGAQVIFSIFDKPLDQIDSLRAEIVEILDAALHVQLPVLFVLDDYIWLGSRPDLWNFFDPSKPGFNESNRFNVEWSSWDSRDALQISWINWGRQLRMPNPVPNMLSPVIQEESRKILGLIIDDILSWKKKVPAEQRYLFIGVKVGWEANVGAGPYYYPNGNSYISKDPKDDPTCFNANNVPERNVSMLGYAAATTSGFANRSFGEMTEALQLQIVQKYLEDISRFIFSRGLPRTEIFTHSGGWNPEEILWNAALNNYSNPGWSTYNARARNPANTPALMRAISQNEAPFMCIAEWFNFFESTNRSEITEEWVQSLNNSLQLPRNRFLVMYNLNSMKEPEYWEALRIILKEYNDKSPACCSTVK